MNDETDCFGKNWPILMGRQIKKEKSLWILLVGNTSLGRFAKKVRTDIFDFMRPFYSLN